MGLKIDRCDNRCALCREVEADKTGSHLAPNFMIHGMFSFDGKGRRNREISMRDHLNTSERMVYYGPEVSPDAINADHGGDLTDEELEENVNNLVIDYLFCKACEDRFGILETYYATYYAEWKHEEVNSRVAYLFWLSVFWRMCVGRMSIFLKGEDEFEMRRIQSYMLLDSSTTDFFKEGHVTLSTVNKAKGNECGVVIICGVDAVFDNPNNVVMRDMLFTSMTRTKGWLTLTGCTESMDLLAKEYKALKDNNYELHFVQPAKQDTKNIENVSRATSKFEENFLDGLTKLRKAGIGEDEISRMIKQLMNLANGVKE